MDFFSTLTYYDYIVVAILLLSILFGIYKGFLSTAGSCVIVCAALLLSLAFTDNLAYTIQQKTNTLEEIIYYVQADEKIDLSLRKTSIYSLTEKEVADIVEEAGLPELFEDKIEKNVKNRSFSAIETLGDYFDYTVGSVTLNILCFCGIFIFSTIILSIVKAGLEAMIKLPALKMVDGLLGAAFAVLRGIVFIYIFLLIVPVILAVLPESIVSKLVGDISETPIASIFYNSNFLTDFIGGFIKTV